MCLVFALLGVLPDADLLVVAMGLSDSSITTGHRGASHSLAVAIALGGAGALLARRLGYGVARTALAVMLAVGSHGVIDAFGEGGRGIPLLWPISDHRFMAPWFLRFLPDAPRGMKFISRTGLASAVTEFVYFLPLTIYALKPWRPLLPELAAPSSDENPRERLPEHPSEGRAQGRSDGRSDDRSDDRSDGHEPPRRASGG